LKFREQGSNARLAKKMRALMAALPGDESPAGVGGIGLPELLAVRCVCWLLLLYILIIKTIVIPHCYQCRNL
jgi:hypothetical protein